MVRGLMAAGHALNMIHNCVKICLYEGADKYDKFSERAVGIRK
jgi:hypothetical protein